MIPGLLAFITGLTGTYTHAVVSSSGKNTIEASPFGKGFVRGKSTSQTITAKNHSQNGTTVSDWQKRKPLFRTDISGSQNMTDEKPVLLPRIPTDPWFRTVTKSLADEINTIEPSKMTYTDSIPSPKQSSVTKPTGREMKNWGYPASPVRFSANYEKANDRNHEKTMQLLTGNIPCDMTCNDIVESHTDRDNIHLGLEYATDNGRINAAVSVIRMKDLKKGAETGNSDSADLKTITIGYTYDVSDKTSFYGIIARTEYEKEAVTAYTRGSRSDEDSVTGFRFGVTHRF